MEIRKQETWKYERKKPESPIGSGSGNLTSKHGTWNLGNLGPEPAKTKQHIENLWS